MTRTTTTSTTTSTTTRSSMKVRTGTKAGGMRSLFDSDRRTWASG